MRKIPDSKPDEIIQVKRPEIETESPHPDGSQSKGAAEIIGGGQYFQWN